MSDPLRAVHPPLRRGLTGLVAAGAVLAATATVLALMKDNIRDGIVYTVVAAGLSIVAIGVARSIRWVTAITLIACAGQIAATIGTTLELLYGVAPFKAAQLHRLGLNPTVGVGINLLYSTMAFGLFCWFTHRWLRERPRRRLP